VSRQRKIPLLRGKWLKDSALQTVLRVLNQEGTTRIAGGAVRNALLGDPVGDVDLATTLTPEQVTAAAETAGLKAHPTGIAHGTVTVTAGGRAFEVTTLRVDVETFGRHAKVRFTDDWMADASRRDFTMNALYCDARGEVYDPLHGLDDLMRRRVRFVGDPRRRIQEDYLRILRFFRFNAQYGKGRPDGKGLAECIRHRRRLKMLSPERIRQELWKLLAAPGAVRMLDIMNERGIAQLLLGRNADDKGLLRMMAVDEALKLAPDPLLRLEVITGHAEQYRDSLRLTNAEMARLKALKNGAAPAPALRPRERKIVLYQLGRQAYLDRVRLAWVRSRSPAADRGWRALVTFGRKTELPRFPVSGDDLKSLGVEPGPGMGALLSALEDWWMASGFPEEKALVLERLTSIAALPKAQAFPHKKEGESEQEAEER
jgi:poly(A) polymerase